MVAALFSCCDVGSAYDRNNNKRGLSAYSLYFPCPCFFFWLIKERLLLFFALLTLILFLVHTRLALPTDIYVTTPLPAASLCSNVIFSMWLPVSIMVLPEKWNQ